MNGKASLVAEQEFAEAVFGRFLFWGFVLRGIRLDPPRQGDPLNYFIYPCAELDGTAFALESRFSFQPSEQ